MGCLDLSVAIINTALAVTGTAMPVTTEVAASVTPPTAQVRVSELAPTGAKVVATICNTKPALDCSLIEAVGGLELTVTLEPVPVVTVDLEPAPIVECEVLNDIRLNVENATAAITTEINPSFVCSVNEDDITVLATADGNPLRTANGGYLRLPDDEDEEIIDEP